MVKYTYTDENNNTKTIQTNLKSKNYDDLMSGIWELGFISDNPLLRNRECDSYYQTEKDKINLLSIFLLCLCSSLTIYFDQKLIFLPSLIFILILNIKINIKFKILAFLFYSLFSLPYIYLIYKWGTIIPPSAASAREVGQTIKLYQLGYCLTILAFYVIPFLLLIDLKLSKIKNKILDKKFLIIILIFSLYLILTIALIDFETLRVEGKGIFHKLSLIIL